MNHPRRHPLRTFFGRPAPPPDQDGDPDMDEENEIDEVRARVEALESRVSAIEGGNP